MPDALIIYRDDGLIAQVTTHSIVPLEELLENHATDGRSAFIYKGGTKDGSIDIAASYVTDPNGPNPAVARRPVVAVTLDKAVVRANEPVQLTCDVDCGIAVSIAGTLVHSEQIQAPGTDLSFASPGTYTVIVTREFPYMPTSSQVLVNED